MKYNENSYLKHDEHSVTAALLLNRLTMDISAQRSLNKPPYSNQLSESLESSNQSLSQITRWIFLKCPSVAAHRRMHDKTEMEHESLNCCMPAEL